MLLTKLWINQLSLNNSLLLVTQWKCKSRQELFWFFNVLVLRNVPYPQHWKGSFDIINSTVRAAGSCRKIHSSHIHYTLVTNFFREIILSERPWQMFQGHFVWAVNLDPSVIVVALQLQNQINLHNTLRFK